MNYNNKIIIIPADNVKNLKIGFTVHEYMGVEVFPFVNGEIDKNPFINESDIYEGMDLAIPGLMGWFHIMKVHKDENGNFYAKTENILASLKFNSDERHCWTCSGLINIKAIKKLYLTK